MTTRLKGDESQPPQSRESRRRRFLRENEAASSSILQDRSEKEIIAHILKFSTYEVREEKVLSSIRNQKNVFHNNTRALSESAEKIDQKTSAKDKQWLKEEVKREISWVVEADMVSQMQRLETYVAAMNNSNQQNNLDIAKDILSKILDIAEWTASVREFGRFFDIELMPYAAPVVAAPQAPPPASAPSKKGSVAGKPTAAASLQPPTVSEVPKIHVNPNWTLPPCLWKDGAATFESNFDVPASLPSPVPTNVHKNLPYSRSACPAAVDKTWLQAAPFSSSNLFAGRQQQQQLLSEDDATTGAVALFEHLAARDTEDFYRKVADMLPPHTHDDHQQGSAGEKPAGSRPGTGSGADKIKRSQSPGLGDKKRAASPSNKRAQSPHSKEKAAAKELDPVLGSIVVDMCKTPSWIVSTSRQYVLGEILVKISCSAYPIPVDPLPKIPVRRFPLRMAVCGMAEIARKEFATALASALPDLAIIYVEQLVISALEESPDGEVEVDESRCGNIRPFSGGQGALTVDQKRKRDVYSRLRGRLRAGEALKDTDLVSLVVEALVELPSDSLGYLLVDFPNTKEQARLLVEALSGADYGSHKPQPMDRVSAFALAKPGEILAFDTSKCGLDFVFFVDLDDDVMKVVNQRVKARVNVTSDIQGAIQYIYSGQQSLVGLQELYTPNRPLAMHSMASMAALTSLVPIQEFFALLGVAKHQPFGTETREQLCFSRSEVLALASTLDQHANQYTEAASSVALLDSISQSVVRFAAAEIDDALPSIADASVITQPSVVKAPEYNELPQDLAVVLNTMWKTGETQSKRAAFEFFNACRDVKYQMLQRRRMSLDTLNVILIRRTNHQSLLEDFVSRFNEIDRDFRFDADCMAELRLRALVLGDSFYEICEHKRSDAAAFIEGIAHDAMLAVWIYRLQCEAAALINAELSRLMLSIDTIFDYTKAVQGYDFRSAIANNLEVTLPFGACKGAEDGKKALKAATKKPDGKGKNDSSSAVPTPYREPFVAAVFQSETMLEAVPRSKFDVAEAEQNLNDPKIKKDTKAKVLKEKDESALLDPLSRVEQTACAAALVWSRDSFTVNRQIYSEDEELSSAIENAIWFEVERFHFSISEIKQTVLSQVEWLNESEWCLINALRGFTSKQFMVEVAVGERVVAMINDVISAHTPITEQWLLASDVVVVMKDRLLLPKNEIEK